MKIYTVESADIAIQLGQLIKLNAECARVKWSRKQDKFPSNVVKAIETIENYVEDKVYEKCNQSFMISELNEDEENKLMGLLKKDAILKNTIGNGVIMAGEEANKVKAVLDSNDVPQCIVKAIETGKNVIIF